MDKGSAPYSTKVTMAPSSVPDGLAASATLIMSTTYIQAMATRYMMGKLGLQEESGS
jgi:hypothetical protein